MSLIKECLIMNKASYENFVSVLSEKKPSMVFFHHKADAAQTQKIKTILKGIEKELPLLPAYEYVVDASEGNQYLAELLGVSNTPILIFYKEGNFHRYKDKTFTKKSIAQFIGNKNLYQERSNEENKNTVNNPSEEIY
jgi:hypothetical protein